MTARKVEPEGDSLGPRRVLKRKTATFINILTQAAGSRYIRLTPKTLRIWDTPDYTFDASIYTLRFEEAGVEEAYRRYTLGVSANQSQWFLVAYALALVVLALVEYLWGWVDGEGFTAILAVRACMLVLLASIFFVGNVRAATANPALTERLLVVLYNLLSATILVVQYVGTEHSDRTSEEELGRYYEFRKLDFPLYFYFLGKWGFDESIMFLVFVTHCSNLTFLSATPTCVVHYAVQLMMVLLNYSHDFPFDFIKAVRPPLFIVICIASCFMMEFRLRADFASRCEINLEQERERELLDSMLPPEVGAQLTHSNKHDLVQQFDQVAILFCYIVRFRENAEATPGQNLVRFLSQIYRAFDRATEQLGVYKVENIADTYMVSCGCPYPDGQHVLKIAKMALVMLRIAEACKWTWPDGQPVQLQIGIHYGPVVAGIVGSKTYSYHLFGDTVNTSSRMCSYSLPGKIQMSEPAHLQLSLQTNKMDVTCRGVIPVKGKGDMQTFWLEGTTDPQLDSLLEAFAEGRVPRGSPNFAKPRPSYAGDSLLQWIRVDKLKLNYIPADSCSENDALQRQVVSYAARLEREFRKHYESDGAPYLRYVIALLTALCALYSVGAGFPPIAFRAIQYLVVALCVTGLAVSFSKQHSHFALLFVRLAFLLFLVLSVIVFAFNRRVEITYDIYLCMTVLGTLLGLRYYLCMLLFTCVLCATIVLMVFGGDEEKDETKDYVFACCSNIVEHAVFMVCCAFLDATLAHAAYHREKIMRRDFWQFRLLSAERERCSLLLRNMLPDRKHAEILMSGALVFENIANATILQADMVGFTPLTTRMTPVQLYHLLDELYSRFDAHLDKLGLYKMDTVGDAFVAIGGLPGSRVNSHATAIVQLGMIMLQEVAAMNRQKNLQLSLRIGIHTGAVVGSIVTIKRPRYLLWGPTPIIAEAMEGACKPGTLSLSEETRRHLDEESLSKMGLALEEVEHSAKTARYTRTLYRLTPESVSEE